MASTDNNTQYPANEVMVTGNSGTVTASGSMVILASTTGNVGIGTTAPAAGLDVNVAAIFRQPVTVLGNLTINNVTVAGTAVVNALISNVYGVFGQNVTVNSTNASTSTGTGALVVSGGVGIGGNINVGGQQNNYTGNLLVNSQGSANIIGSNPTVPLMIGTLPKASSPIGTPSQGTMLIVSNDAANQLQGWMQLVGDPTDINRRLTFQAIEQGISSRGITLQENGGNVGIGTSDTVTQSNGSVGRILKISSPLNTFIVSETTASLSANLGGGIEARNPNRAIPRYLNIAWSTSPDNGGYIAIKPAPPGGAVVSSTVGLGINSNSNVLIGTTGGVNGIVNAYISTATVVINSAKGGGIQYFNNNNGGGNVSALSGGGLAWSTFTGAIGSEVTTEAMRLDTLGNLIVRTATGIGTSSAAGMSTTNVSSNLYVWGNVIVANTALTSSGIYFPNGSYLTTGTYGPTNTIQVAGGGNSLLGDSTNFVWDLANRRLGIGTSTPSYQLSVYGTDYVLFNTRPGSATRQEITVGNVVSFGAVLGYDPSLAQSIGYLRRGDSAATTPAVAWSYVSSNYRVGINGITIPQNALDVNGTLAVGNNFAGVVTGPANGMIVQGKVGIGTGTPTSSGNSLETLFAATGGGTQWSSGGASPGGGNVQAISGGGLVFSSYTGAVGAETYTTGLRITSTGNVIIGPATATGTGGSITAQGGFIPSTSAWTAASFAGIGSYGGALSLIDSGTAGFALYTTGTGTQLNFAQGLASAGTAIQMQLLSGGNLLLGTTTNTAIGTGVVVVNSAKGGGAVFVNNNSGGGNISALSGGGLAVGTFTQAIGSEVPSERMRINSTGFVGIGTNIVTSNAVVEAQTFTSNGSVIWAKNYLGPLTSPTEAADWPWPVISATAYGNYYLQTMMNFNLPGDGPYQTGDNAWSIRLNGVTSSGWDNNSVTTPSAVSSSAVGLQILGPGNMRIGTVNAQNVFIRTNNVDRMSVDGNGNVGIGTSGLNYFGKIAAFTSDATDLQFLQRIGSGTFRVRSPSAGLVLAGSPYGDAVGFETSATERMRIASGGAVGIGTTLQLGNSTLNVDQGVVARTTPSSGVTPYLQVYNGNAGTDLKTWRIGGGAAGQLTIEQVNDAYSAANAIVTVTKPGTNATGNLAVTGNITASLEITAYFSDLRLKDNIKIITNAMDKVMAINGVYYNPNQLAEDLVGESRTTDKVGLIAQEVEAIMPQVIRSAPFDIGTDGHSVSGANYMTIQYDKLVPLLVQAIKEQQAQIESLEARITTLEQHQ